MRAHYRGWRSTKLHVSLLAMLVVTVVYWRMGLPAAQFGEFCNALIMGAGFYAGASAVEKFTKPDAAGDK